jgi:hypothetical protein
VYKVKSSNRTNIGGEIYDGRMYRDEIEDVVSCTCMTPTLLHKPCSHVITTCRMRRVLHERSNYMSPYYLLLSKRYENLDLSRCSIRHSGSCPKALTIVTSHP